MVESFFYKKRRAVVIFSRDFPFTFLVMHTYSKRKHNSIRPLSYINSHSDGDDPFDAVAADLVNNKSELSIMDIPLSKRHENNVIAVPLPKIEVASFKSENVVSSSNSITKTKNYSKLLPSSSSIAAPISYNKIVATKLVSEAEKASKFGYINSVNMDPAVSQSNDGGVSDPLVPSTASSRDATGDNYDDITGRESSEPSSNRHCPLPSIWYAA